jgi:hypothetical protein
VQTLPTTTTDLATALRALVPGAIVVARTNVHEGTRSMALDAGEPDVVVMLAGRTLRLDHDGEGWLGQIDSEELEVVRDAEDLAWMLCDLRGWARPRRKALQVLADEAGAAGDGDTVTLAHAAILGDAHGILACAETIADAADRAANG